jgi:hypothetical protein
MAWYLVKHRDNFPLPYNNIEKLKVFTVSFSIQGLAMRKNRIPVGESPIIFTEHSNDNLNKRMGLCHY